MCNLVPKEIGGIEKIRHLKQKSFWKNIKENILLTPTSDNLVDKKFWEQKIIQEKVLFYFVSLFSWVRTDIIY